MIEIRNLEFLTALIFAAAHGHNKIMGRLLKYRNFDVNMVDGSGRTEYARNHGKLPL